MNGLIGIVQLYAEEPVLQMVRNRTPSGWRVANEEPMWYLAFMLGFRLAAAVIANVLIFAVPLFAVAGTLGWWRAWVILGLMLIGTVLSVSSLPRGLLEERLQPPIQKSQPTMDRVLVILLLAAFIGLLIVTPLTVFHLHPLAKPGPFVSSVGLALYVVGFWIAYLALRENAFAAPVVKFQEDRNQTVVASGVYSAVRHPMYAGGLLLAIGLPLWLESYVGAFFAIAAIGTILVARIVFEERFLKRNLPGYDAYAKRVKFHLVPFLW